METPVALSKKKTLLAGTPFYVDMVGGAGLEPATSSASRKRSSSELTTRAQ